MFVESYSGCVAEPPSIHPVPLLKNILIFLAVYVFIDLKYNCSLGMSASVVPPQILHEMLNTDKFFMMQLWINVYLANANFLYGMNMLKGGSLGMLLLSLIK